MLKFIIPIIVGVFTFFIIKYDKENGYKGGKKRYNQALLIDVPMNKRKSLFK